MKAKFNLNYILSTVCSYYSIDAIELKGISRKGNINHARQMFMYLSRNHSESSLIKVGEMVNRDHATVLHSCNKISIEKEIYNAVKNDIQEIEVLLYSTMIPIEVDLLKLSINYTNSFL